MLCRTVARICVCRPLVVTTSGSARVSVPERCSKALITTRKFGSVMMPVIVVSAGAPSGFRNPPRHQLVVRRRRDLACRRVSRKCPQRIRRRHRHTERWRASAVRNDIPVHIIAQVPVETQRRVISFQNLDEPRLDVDLWGNPVQNLDRVLNRIQIVRRRAHK